MAYPFDKVSPGVIYLIQVVAFIILAELGYWLGSYRHKHAKDPSRLPISRGTGAIMALLAFMLAFTFGLGSSRYDTRKQLIIEETNAVGTAYLRAMLLPDPQKQKCMTILREYVRDRSTTGIDYSEAMQLNERSKQLHDRLWDQVLSLKSNDDYSRASISFTHAVNNLIDLHNTRLNASLRNRIPMGIWLTLYIIAVFSMILNGYTDGLAGKQQSVFAGVIVVLTFSVVLLLIHQLDRPLSDSHLIGISKQAMVDLLQTMKAP